MKSAEKTKRLVKRMNVRKHHMRVWIAVAQREGRGTYGPGKFRFYRSKLETQRLRAQGSL